MNPKRPAASRIFRALPCGRLSGWRSLLPVGSLLLGLHLPAAALAASIRLRVAVEKNSSTGPSSNDGELRTSTSTCASRSESATPTPLSTSTPVLRDASTTSWPSERTSAQTWPPI